MELNFKDGRVIKTVSFVNLKRGMELHQLLRLRQRYILTKNNRLRLRYAAGGSVAVLAMLSLLPAGMGLSLSPQGGSALQIAMGDVPVAEETLQIAQVDNADMNAAMGAMSPEDAVQDDYASSSSSWAIAQNIQSGISSSIRKASLSMKKAMPNTGEIKIGKGETVAGALEKAGVAHDEAYQVVKALGEHIDMREVQAGQVLDVKFAAGAPDVTKIDHLTMEIDPLETVTLARSGDAFTSTVAKKELETKTYAGYAKIQNSLYGSAERAGIPPAVLAHVIRLYSRTIDFQRDIRQGDEIEVLYDGQQTENGDYKKTGNIIFANLTIGGKQVPIYRFENEDGSVDYYDEKGQTTRKTLLKTPIDGARVSSGFGMRRHPVLGYSKMHKGVDFAAPTGTPIYAAGDGTVEFAGRKGGYGNFVTLRHTSQYKTGYAHMYKFAKGISNGTRVKQGEVIGYVGTTGRSTGPHLHYEVMVAGRQVNPRSVDLPAGENLKGKELAQFKRTMGSIRQQFVSLVGGVKFAQTGASDSGNGG